MSRHPETNPHFVRPLQQPRRDRGDGRRSTPPAVITPPVSGPATPPPPRHHNQEIPDPGNQHFPLHVDEELLPPRNKPLGPIRHQERGQFRSPWAIPPHHPQPAHGPAHDGNYQSPWILPPSSSHPTDDHGPLVTEPHRHDSEPPPHPRPQPPPKHPRHHRQHRDGRKHPPPPPPPHDGPDPAVVGHRRGRGPVVPSPRKTKITTWCAAVCCAIFWIAIFLVGLIVLIVYLVYRPHNPRFEVSDATLNAAYLDAGSLLNADVSVLANFTNPNRKVAVEFGSLIVDLYYGSTLIATQFIQPFSADRAGSRFVNLELVTSQVRIPLEDSKKLEEQINKNTVTFNVKGVFRVRSKLGSFLRYSYKLYGHCTIVTTGPPNGILRGKRCITKR
ncbi:unnamed protein product [Linum tenue]|uniref:Late embryogenesis abundant protein LEA-2 subgroup domain-containing protein n=1 Tax=Linum tenue TaxID=586396 RepID=A0AAV0P0C3_9ROSI|nr:unnamed protein product [Linum tenue]